MCYTVCQLQVQAGLVFFLVTNKTDSHDITVILSKVQNQVTPITTIRIIIINW